MILDNYALYVWTACQVVAGLFGMLTWLMIFALIFSGRRR